MPPLFTSVENQLMYQRTGCVALILLLAIAPGIARGQTNTSASIPASLPSVAQKALDKGIGAAKAENYLEAIRFFETARKIAPQASMVYFNLALAESKIPGRELRSICWFEAYLTLVPDAANAPAVRQQISNLEENAKSNVGKLIEMLKVLASQFPPRHYWVPREPIAAFAALYVKNGDPSAAEQLIRNLSNKEIQTESRVEIVEVLAKSKRIAEAIKQADQLTDIYVKQRAYRTITSAQTEAGLFGDAKKSLEIVTDTHDRVTLLLELAEAEYRAGQHEDAEARFADARSVINKAWGKEVWLAKCRHADFAVSKYRMGQREASDALLQELMDFADHTTGKQKNGNRLYALLALARAENDLGRRSGALKTMDKAEKAWLTVKRENEEELGITGGYNRIYYAYLYSFKDLKRAEAFMSRPEVRTNFTNGIEGVKKTIVTAKAKNEAESAQAAAKMLAAGAGKALADSTAMPAQRAQAWAGYVNGCLNAPLFTVDFKVTMNALVNFTPRADDQVKAQTLFMHVERPAEDLVDAINDLQHLRNQSASRNSPGP